MLHFFVPCPWPIPYYAIFIWTHMEYNLFSNNSSTANIESCVEFPTLLSHMHCEFLLAHISRTCQITDYQCDTNVTRNPPYIHKLRLTYQSQIPVRGIPGIEPPMIPLGLGDHFPFRPPPPMTVGRSMNTDPIVTTDAHTGTSP